MSNRLPHNSSAGGLPVNNARFLNGLPILGILLLFAWGTFEWVVNRIEVPINHSLMLRYKGPLLLGISRFANGRFAGLSKDGYQEVGVLEHMPGPGRHFYCPIWWERKIVPDAEVQLGELGIVTSKLGDQLPPGKYLVEGDIGSTTSNGILRKVYGPGRYRVNPYGYDFKTIKTEVANSAIQAKHSGWVEIPAGYVGVVTLLTDNEQTGEKAGIQDKVLQPGIYLINRHERVVDVVLVGYYEKSITTSLSIQQNGRPKLDAGGEPELASDGSGISFPSSDGFPVHIDFSAIWGIMPDQAPQVIRHFGNLKAVEDKIITPQIESICRNIGSQYGASQLLSGDQREDFQKKIFDTFSAVLREKDITVLNGLVRYIYIPREVRLPIQKANLANEIKLTSEQKELTARTEGVLREAEKNVDLAAETVRVDTEKKLANVKADAQRTAAETQATTQKRLAEIDRKTAELDRQALVMLGESTGKAKQLVEEAKSDRFRLAVEAFGTGAAFNHFTFANGLSNEIKLQTLYAGDGTLWTDLKSFTDVMLARQTAPQKTDSVPANSSNKPKLDTK